MSAAKPPAYTVTTLARALGVSHPQVSQWKGEGMPFTPAGRITIPAAVRWLRERERRERPRLGASESNDRRAAAEAQLAELRLAKELGEVVMASDVLARDEDEVMRVRAIVLSMTTHAPLLATRCGCTLREASAALRDLAEVVLSELAKPDDEPDTDEEEAA
jgi:terminase small subunit / prophage DNA-packing protein